MQNLKIEINEKYSQKFLKCFPNKQYNKISIKAIESTMLNPSERKLIHLGFKVCMDENHILMICNSEEISSINGILVVQKIITSEKKDYINITLWNTTNAQFHIKEGDVIAEAYLLSAPLQYDIQRVGKI